MLLMKVFKFFTPLRLDHETALLESDSLNLNAFDVLLNNIF